MKPTVRSPIVACLATAALLFGAGDATAQDVLLHEVRAEGNERWIELHNRSGSAVNLSTWSLHYVTRTPGMPQTYWWAFPSGTSIGAGAFLRVHWYQPAPASAAAGELYTGDTPYHFLFGLGSEALLAQRGALALLSSQQNALMNSASIVEDWVSWGEHDFPRETLAVQAGVWSAGRHVPSIPSGQSLARQTALVGSVTFQDEAWFFDATPTPLQPNLSGALVEAYGDACALPGHHLLGLPELRTGSLPLLGNAQFGFAIDATTGIYGEFALLVFSAGPRPAGQPSALPPYAGVGCQESIDPVQFVTAWLLPTQILTTDVPLSLAGLPTALVGAELHAQAMVIDLLPFAYPPYQGITNALRVVLGQ